MNPPPDSPSPSTPQHKPQGMAWESFVERRIREAQAAGAFDNLPGTGRPIPGIDEPLDEDWWVKNKLREEGVNVVPPILSARLDRERTLEQLPRITSEDEIRRILTALNERLLAAMKSPAAGPSAGVSLVDVDAAIGEWRARL